MGKRGEGGEWLVDSSRLEVNKLDQGQDQGDLIMKNSHMLDGIKVYACLSISPLCCYYTLAHT